MKKLMSLLLVSICLVGGFTEAGVNDGLVAYYPFNGDANDASGHANIGTVYGAELTNDRFGRSLSAYIFDGVDDHIIVDHSESFDTINDGITVAAWIKFNNADPVTWPNAFIFEKSNAWEAMYYTVNNNVNMHLRYLGAVYTKGITWEADTWYHIAGTYSINDGIERMYVNGKWNNAYSAGGPVRTSTAKLYIGAKNGNHDNFEGVIDEVRIYNRAFSPNEVAQLYNFQACHPSLDVSLNNDMFSIGDNLIVNGHVTKPCGDSVQVEMKLWMKYPNDSMISLMDPYTNFTANAGDDFIQEIFNYVFSGSELEGTFEVGGRLLNTSDGGYFSSEIEAFEFAR